MAVLHGLGELLLVVTLHLLEQCDISEQSLVVVFGFVCNLLLLVIFEAFPGEQGAFAGIGDGPARAEVEVADGAALDFLEFSAGQPRLEEGVLELFDGVVLALHVVGLDVVPVVDVLELFLEELGLLSELLHFYFGLVPLGSQLQPAIVVLHGFLLPEQLLLQLLAHRLLLLDYRVVLRGLLREAAHVAALLQLFHLVLVHLYPFVGVRQFLAQHFEVVLPLENALPLARLLVLLQPLEFLLDGSLDLDEFGLEFGVFELEGFDEFFLGIGLAGRAVHQQRRVDELVIH